MCVMCHMCVSYMCAIYMGVWYVCVIDMCVIYTYVWYSVTFVCDMYVCIYSLYVWVCVYVCAHVLATMCDWKSEDNLKETAVFFHRLDPGYYFTWVLRLGSFFPWSHQPLACLFFSLSDSMYWTSLYFVILFKMDVCTWNYHNLIFFALNTKDANALSSGYFFFYCSPGYVILKEVFLKWTYKYNY